MGQMAKLKQQRRTARRELAAFTRSEHATRVTDPRLIAKIAEAENDTEIAAIMARDTDAQTDRLNAAGWRIREVGADGLGMWDHRRGVRLIHSVTRWDDGQVWSHMSLSRRDNTLPGWYEVRDCHRLIYPDRSGLIIIPPASDHYSIAEIHHVWTCLSADVVPDFRFMGAI